MLLLLKTDIYTAREARLLELVFSSHPQIKQWSVDMEDVDRVLRIVSTTMTYSEAAAILWYYGFYCGELQ